MKRERFFRDDLKTEKLEVCFWLNMANNVFHFKGLLGN